VFVRSATAAPPDQNCSVALATAVRVADGTT
jgi:hypothetical protein